MATQLEEILQILKSTHPELLRLRRREQDLLEENNRLLEEARNLKRRLDFTGPGD